eukprot:scaffold108253_cov45-Phaeocystis_antarctica.AAC.1
MGKPPGYLSPSGGETCAWGTLLPAPNLQLSDTRLCASTGSRAARPADRARRNRRREYHKELNAWSSALRSGGG